MKIIKFIDLVSVKIFINKLFSCNSYSSHLCILATIGHNCQTRFAMNGLLILPSRNTSKFSMKAFLYFTITSRNFFQAFFSENNFRIMYPISLKKLWKCYFLIYVRKNLISIMISNYNLMMSMYWKQSWGLTKKRVLWFTHNRFCCCCFSSVTIYIEFVKFDIV